MVCFSTGKSTSRTHSTLKTLGSFGQNFRPWEIGGNNPSLVSEKIADQRALCMNHSISLYFKQVNAVPVRAVYYWPKGLLGDCYSWPISSDATKAWNWSFDASEQPFMGPSFSAQAADVWLQAYQKLVALGATPVLEMTGAGQAKTGYVTPALSMRPDMLITYPDPEIPLVLYALFGYGLFGSSHGVLRTKHAIWPLCGFIVDDKNDTSGSCQTQSCWHYQLGTAKPQAQLATAPFGGTGASGQLIERLLTTRLDYCAYPVSSIEARQA